MKIKNLITLSPPASSFFSGSASLRNCLPPHLEQCRWRGWGHCGQLRALHLCDSFFLILVPCSNMGSFPWDTVLTELLQHGPSHSLQFFKNCSRSLPRGTVLQEHLLQHGTPGESEVLPKILLQCGCLSLQAAVPARSLLQSGLSMRSQLHTRCIHLPWHKVPHRLQGHICLTMILTMGFRAPPASPSSLTLAPSRPFLPYFSHSLSLTAVAQDFLSSLTHYAQS